MFSNLLRQQARLAFSTRLTVPLRQQSQKSVLALSTQKSQILSQRTFSISRSLFEEVPVTPITQTHGVDATSHSQTSDAGVEEDAQKQRSLYVGNLPYSAEEAEIRELFAPYGQVERVSLASDADGRQRGYAFVEFQSLEAAEAAVQSSMEEPFALLNRNLRVNFAQNRPTMRRNAKQKNLGEPSSTIHIANYPRPGDDRPLRQLLGDYEDKILRVHFMKDYAGNYTEKTFINFKDTRTATAVLENFQEELFEGTNLKLYYAKERNRDSSERTRQPFRQRRSSGGRDYDA